jgi:hypothetical protein
MSLDNLVLAAVSGIANLCDEVLHGEDSAKYTKDARQNAVQYIHFLKDMLKCETAGQRVDVTPRFRELVDYFSNYFVQEKAGARRSFNKFCNMVSLTCLSGGMSGVFFRDSDGMSRAGYFVMGVGFGGFLLSEFFRLVLNGIMRNKENEIVHQFDQISNAGDDVWRNAVSRIRYDTRKYLDNHKWYG